jgi:O-antigen/teichoic acid export membrane protein
MYVYAPLLFKVIFGEEWEQAGEVAQWMAISVFFKFCNTPLTVFLVLERQDLGLYMQMVLLSLRCIGIALGVMYSDFIGTIILYSVMSAIGYVVFLLIKVHIAGGRVMKFFSNISYYLALSVGAFLPMLIVEFNEIIWVSLIPISLTFIILVFYYLSLFKKFNVQNVP